MLATLITDKNRKFFEKAMPEDVKENADLFIGAVDTETDTACGVLAAEALSEEELFVDLLYVEDKFRYRGAGMAMVRFLQDLSAELDISRISCSQVRLLEDDPDGEDKDALAVLFYDCGFTEDPVGDIFRMNLSDIKAERTKTDAVLIPLSDIESAQWEELEAEFDGFNGDAEYGMLGNREDYSEKYSFIAFNREKKQVGAILVRPLYEDMLIDKVINNSVGGKDDISGNLILRTVRALKDDRGKDSFVYIHSGNDRMTDFVNALTDNRAKLSGVAFEEHFEVPVFG